jgi:hypothetical protein
MAETTNDEALLQSARGEIKQIEKQKPVKKLEPLINKVKWRENPKEVFVAVHRAHKPGKRTVFPPTLTFLVGDSCESSLSIKLTQKQYKKLKELGFYIC